MNRCAGCFSPDTPGCYGPFLGRCGDPAYADLIRRESGRRGADCPPPPVAYAGPASRPPRSFAGLPPGGVAQVWPAAFVGGAERAMIAIIKATSPAVRWRGVALLADAEHHAPEILDELRALGPVAIGRDEARSLLAGAAAVVSWAAPDAVDLLGEGPDRPKLIAVSHSPGGSAWAMETLGKTRGVDRWVAVSEGALEPIPADQRGRAVVIPNAIEPGRLRVTRDRAAMLAGWGLPPDAKVLGGLNRLSSEKRPRALVDAVAALPPGWYGVMVGEGAERADLERHAAEVAPGRVIFPGNRSDVGDVLAAFDWLLVASEYESFCLSMAEALWMGVPVVSTPVGIAREYPHAVRLVPPGASGDHVADTVARGAVFSPPGGHADPRFPPVGGPADPAIGRALARRLWGPDALARAWGGLLRPLAGGSTPGQKARACVWRGCRTGCQHALCGRDHKEVHISECLVCTGRETQPCPG